MEQFCCRKEVGDLSSKENRAWGLVTDIGCWRSRLASQFLLSVLNVHATWRWESCWELSCSWESKLLDRETSAYYRGARHLCQGNSASKVIGICFHFCGWAKEIRIGLKSVWTDCDRDIFLCVCVCVFTRKTLKCCSELWHIHYSTPNGSFPYSDWKKLVSRLT